MDKVENQFKEAVQETSDGLLSSPGHEGMVAFFHALGYNFDARDIETVYTQYGWEGDRSLTLDDVLQVAKD